MSHYLVLSGLGAMISSLIPIALALVNYKFLNKSLKIILYFLLLSLVCNIINQVFVFQHKPDLFIPHIYTVFEFALISFFYYTQFIGFIKKMIPFLVAAFTIACLLNFFFLQDYKIQYNSYTRAVEAVIVIFYSMLFFLNQSEADQNHSFVDLSQNWVNIGLLIFYSCNFFVLAFSNFLLSKGIKAALIAWLIYDIFLVAENILFAIAFHKCKKRQTTSLY